MNGCELYQSVVIDYFDSIRKDIDDKYDTFRETRRLDINLARIEQIHTEYLKTIDFYQSKALLSIKNIKKNLTDNNEILSAVFENNFLAYLKSHYSEDRDKCFGKLVLFKKFVPLDKIEFINKFEPCMKIEKLDQNILESILLLMKLDETIEYPELIKSGRHDIWMKDGLCEIDNQINPHEYTRMNFECFKISSLADRLFENFTNLVELRFCQCCLNLFSSESFNGLNNLKILQLQSNGIDFLQPDIFKNLVNLTELELHFNCLIDIDEKLFSSLTNLEYLGLGHNQLGFIENNSFSSLRKLKRLDLHGNCLRKVKKEWFSNLDNLETLNLSKNFENSSYGFVFKSDLFESLTNLKTLHLSFNMLENFENDIFKNLNKLENLDLIRCSLRNRINKIMFNNLNNLKALHLDSNEITEIDPIFGNMNNMEYFTMSYNKLEYLPENFFASFHKLKILDLHNNNLKVVKKDWFENMTELEQLHLNWNKISDLEANLFVKLKKLKYLAIQDNQIKVPKKEAFNGLGNLELHYDDDIDMPCLIDDFYSRNINLISQKCERKYRIYEE